VSAKNDEKVAKEIIKRYGATLDLKSSPYLIVEIIRQYGGKIASRPEADCQPPGGPPPKKFDPSQLARELNARLADVSRLSSMLEKAMNPKVGQSVAKKTPAK
jgi:hypothetical protein